jgi:hypothetical protein
MRRKKKNPIHVIQKINTIYLLFWFGGGIGCGWDAQLNFKAIVDQDGHLKSGFFVPSVIVEFNELSKSVFGSKIRQLFAELQTLFQGRVIIFLTAILFYLFQIISITV